MKKKVMSISIDESLIEKGKILAYLKGGKNFSQLIEELLREDIQLNRDKIEVIEELRRRK